MVNFSWKSDAAIKWTESLLEILASYIYRKDMDAKGNNMSKEHWQEVCDSMNRLYSSHPSWKTELTTTIAKSR